ncbi:hypothetical protein ZWY2020_012845 [Hordeum vulgare]|nr:hypothetical protein ZWY2020_012845 [Hordeum vulgare]
MPPAPPGAPPLTQPPQLPSPAGASRSAHPRPLPFVGLAELARKHGLVMYLRMGTCGVVVSSSPSTARTFLKALDARFANRPAMASTADITYGRQNMVFADYDYGPKWKLMWKRRRGVHCRRAVGDRALRHDEAARGMSEAAEAGRAVVVPEVLVFPPPCHRLMRCPSIA